MSAYSHEHTTRLASMLDTTTTVLREGEEPREDARIVRIGAVRVAVDPVLAGAHLDEFRHVADADPGMLGDALRLVALDAVLGELDRTGVLA
jgi:hypothetical protein